MLIAFIGPDGCGKTTMCEIVVESDVVARVAPRIRNMNFGILPQFSTIRAAFTGPGQEDSVPSNDNFLSGMRVPVNSLPKSLILYAWYFADFMLGWFAACRARVFGETIVFSRYYYDYYFQRAHANLPKWLVRSGEALIPRPDFVFFLHCDGDAIYARKPELTPEEIARQNEIIAKLAATRTNFHILDGNRPLNEVADDALSVLCREKH